MDASNALTPKPAETGLAIPIVRPQPSFASSAPIEATVEATHADLKILRAARSASALVSVHEAGHAACICLVSAQILSTDDNGQPLRGGQPIRVKGIDVEAASALGGHTRTDHGEVVGYETLHDIRNQVICALAGREAERALGNLTTGGEHDLRVATRKAVDAIDAGLLDDPGEPLVGHFDSISASKTTETMRMGYADKLTTFLTSCRDEAQALIVANLESVNRLAEIIYSAGSLAGPALLAALREAGFTVPDDIVELPGARKR